MKFLPVGGPPARPRLGVLLPVSVLLRLLVDGLHGRLQRRPADLRGKRTVQGLRHLLLQLSVVVGQARHLLLVVLERLRVTGVAKQTGLLPNQQPAGLPELPGVEPLSECEDL